MARDFISGLMEERIKVVMRMMNNMDTVSTPFLMGDVTKAIGRMDNNTVRASLFRWMAKKLKVPGITAIECTIGHSQLLDKVPEGKDQK